jgi:hypothetical protein
MMRIEFLDSMPFIDYKEKGHPPDEINFVFNG